MKRKATLTAVFSSLILFFAGSGTAAVVEWDDGFASDSKWGSGDNWDPNGTPGTADTVQHNEVEGTLLIDDAYTIETARVMYRTSSVGSVETGSATWEADGTNRSVTVTDSLLVGRGSNSHSTYWNLMGELTTDGIDLNVGSAGARATMTLGEKIVADHNKGTRGTVSVQNGTFTAYLSRLDLGRNTTGNGYAHGYLYLNTNATSVVDISGDMNLGHADVSNAGKQSNGIVEVEDGTFNIGGNLRLARDTGSENESRGTKATLNMTNSTFEVAGDVSMAGTDGYGSKSWEISEAFINTTVDGQYGGLDLSATSSLDINTDASLNTITVTFNANPDALDPDGWYWGLRWAGDHETSLEGLLGDGRLVVDDSGLSTQYQQADYITFDSASGYTYVGAYNIPEPATLALLALGGVGLLRRRQ